MLPAIYNDIILEFLKNKRLTAIFVMYFLVVSLLFVQITHAFFADTASSLSNTFTAAAEFPTPTPSNIATHIVISEIQTASAAADNDFVELYNPSTASASLQGMRLVKRTNGGTVDTNVSVFGPSDIIPAHGYYLWANKNNNFDVSIGANASSTDTLSSDNSVALRDGPENSGTIIDALRWGNPSGTPLVEGAAFTPNPSANQSIERKALSTSDVTLMTSGADVSKGNGYDTNNNSTDFIQRPTSEPQNTSSTPESP